MGPRSAEMWPSQIHARTHAHTRLLNPYRHKERGILNRNSSWWQCTHHSRFFLLLMFFQCPFTTPPLPPHQSMTQHQQRVYLSRPRLLSPSKNEEKWKNEINTCSGTRRKFWASVSFLLHWGYSPMIISVDVWSRVSTPTQHNYCFYYFVDN